MRSRTSQHRSTPPNRPRPRRFRPFRTTAAITTALATALAFTAIPAAHAIATAPNLGTAAEYSVLGGQTVTNTGPSVLAASVGVHPGTAITGFGPGTYGGEIHAGDAQSLQAQNDLTIAYDDAAGQATDTTLEPPTPGAPVELGGRKPGPGGLHRRQRRPADRTPDARRRR